MSPFQRAAMTAESSESRHPGEETAVRRRDLPGARSQLPRRGLSEESPTADFGPAAALPAWVSVAFTGSVSESLRPDGLCVHEAEPPNAPHAATTAAVGAGRRFGVRGWTTGRRYCCPASRASGSQGGPGPGTHGNISLAPGPLLHLLDVSPTGTLGREGNALPQFPAAQSPNATPEDGVTLRGLCRTNVRVSTGFTLRDLDKLPLKGKHCRVKNTGEKTFR